MVNPSGIARSPKRLVVKVALFDLAVLFILLLVSVMIAAGYKQRLAEQLTESFRAPLISGDNRLVMLDMGRPVENDFLGVIWRPADGDGYSFSVPAGFTMPRTRFCGISRVNIYFDEQRSVEAGALTFYYKRWESFPLVLLFWSVLVGLSALIGRSEWRRLEREYRLNVESEMNEIKAIMAAQVAHDIRSPLAALDTALADLEALPAGRRELVRGAVGRIREIARDLLENYKRPGAAAAGKPAGAQDLAALIGPVLAEKRAQYAARPEVIIDFTAPGVTRAGVQAAELRRIVSNLVNNAVEAFEAGGRVGVELSRIDGKVLLKIADNGKGIPAEVLAKLGQKGETHGKAGGTGLGLYHASTTVQSWGGSLDIDSAPGKGTTVNITLPAAAEAPPAAALTILIDDDALVRMNWKAAARSAGAELKAFASAEDFYAAGDIPKDAAIYIDSELGAGVKGEELAEALKAKGYLNLCLETGHPAANFASLPWLRIAGKEPPWIA